MFPLKSAWMVAYMLGWRCAEHQRHRVPGRQRHLAQLRQTKIKQCSHFFNTNLLIPNARENRH